MAIKNLKEKYNTEIKKELATELNLKNIMSVPTLDKIVLNIGAGKAKDDTTLIPELIETLELITGQHPLVIKSRIAVSEFRLKKGIPIGLKVTLRSDRMWFFLDKLINISLPRTKDFRGISAKAFDGRGNYSLGITDQSIFPEIDGSKNNRLHGLQISIITTADNDVAGKMLLKKLGLPLKDQ